MKLALSNLAIAEDASDADFETLAASGVSGIEVAPTRIAPWSDLDDGRLAAYRSRLAGSGLAISSLQALLFGVDGAHLLRDDAGFACLIDHLRRVAEIGARLGAHIGVFGSPRNRSRGDLSLDAAWELGRSRLRLLAEAVYAEGFSLGLEPVPEFYGCDFLQTAGETITMVKEVDHPGLRIHLDTGCVTLGGGDIVQAIEAANGALAHFHIAEPKLASLRGTVIAHDAAARALTQQGYDGWVAIEMLRPPVDADAEIAYSVKFAKETYL